MIGGIINITIPLLTAFFCYFKLKRLMRVGQMMSLISVMKRNYSIIFWYCILPILCLAPDLLCDIYYLPGASPLPVLIATSVLYHTWGIISLFGYWSLTKPQIPIKKEGFNDSFITSS